MPRPPKPELSAKSRATRLLARREHSAAELQRKLRRRGVEADAAQEAVSELTREGWQDDGRFAAMLVRSRVGQGFGPVRIAAELRQAGLPSELIRAALDEASADWTALAVQVHQKHFRELPATHAERAKHYRYLQGRGFESRQIAAVLKGGDEE